jgi:TolB-like protein/DNA-binding winged helix-turn-helix (wHTH) protein/Tfp pilus assembly protein PilF
MIRIKKNKFLVGEWIVEPELGRVYSGDTETSLQPQVMQLLVFMAEHPGEVISIERMIDEVWLGKPMTSGSVYNALNALRKAFDDSTSQPRYIKTIPRLGYQLIAEVQQTGAPASAGDSAVATGTGRNFGPASIIGLVVLILAIVILAWVNGWLNAVSGTATLTVPVPEKSIAVLPFANRSQLEQDIYFTDGIHEELLSRLSGIEDLKVTSRTSVMHFRNSELTLPEIAKVLSVANILEGRVQRSGDQIRISVQLIDAQSDKHLWSETYDRELTVDNLFAIQSEISAEIAQALNSEFMSENEMQALSLPTSSLDAYDSYLRGRQLIANRNAEDTRAAQLAFLQAVETDPEFAQAWVGVANATMLINFNDLVVTPEGREKHWQAVQKALALDAQLAEAQASLGMYYVQAGDPQKAQEAFLHSIALNPNYAQAYHWYSLSYAGGVTQQGATRGNPANASRQLALLYKASELDPLSSIIQLNIGEVLLNSGRYDDAMAVFQRLLQYKPDFRLGLVYVARLHWWNGRLAESLKWLRKLPGIGLETRQSRLSQADAILSLNDEAAFNEVKAILSEEDDTVHWRRILIEHRIAFTQGDFEQTLAVLDNLPDETAGHPWIMESRLLTHVAMEQWQEARQVFTQLRSGLADPGQWGSLVKTYGRMPGSCLAAAILVETGDQALGDELLLQSLHYREVILPTLMEDTDFGSDLVICYLVSGAYEQALGFYERRVAHGHILDWWELRHLPWWEPVRENPRFLALVQRIESLLSEQRYLIEQME